MRSPSVSQGDSLSPISLPQIENQINSKVSTPPVATPKRVSGGYALLDSLKLHGVEYIFGYPGGAILPIYDDLYKAEVEGRGIKHILVRHEQGGLHTLLMVMLVQQAKSESALELPVPEQPI